MVEEKKKEASRTVAWGFFGIFWAFQILIVIIASYTISDIFSDDPSRFVKVDKMTKLKEGGFELAIQFGIWVIGSILLGIGMLATRDGRKE